jgi:predicted RNA-binding protein with PIN domain
LETIIIDAYNLIHKVSELRILLQQSQDACVDAMVSKLHSHYFGRKTKCILVFDGYGKNRHDQNIDVKFSKTDTGPDYGHADALIKHLVEKSRNPKLLKIVSSDREITFYAKDCGARIQTADTFWGEVKDRRIERIEDIRSSKEKPEIVTKGEFDYLLKEFKKGK